jgi:hypothetical protein
MSDMFRTCKLIEQWLQTQTKQKITNVHRSESYLYVIWGESNKISKIKIPAKVLYCFHVEHFMGLIKEMNDTYSFLKV